MIAYATADSPVGMAAYILDKWQKWTDTRARDLEAIHGRDRLLTEVTLYLVTDSFATSLWFYAGFALEPFSIPAGLHPLTRTTSIGWPTPGKSAVAGSAGQSSSSSRTPG